jgi:class 3 adenylate cyclase
VRRYEPDPPSRRDPRPDVAGYSRLMGADEEGTFERLKALRHEFVDPKIAERHGGIVKTIGVEAVSVAVASGSPWPPRCRH